MDNEEFEPMPEEDEKVKVTLNDGCWMISPNTAVKVLRLIENDDESDEIFDA